MVKTLTKTGITICATIHNPTPYCFNLFDRLMILLHGRVVYSGLNGALPPISAVVMTCALWTAPGKLHVLLPLNNTGVQPVPYQNYPN